MSRRGAGLLAAALLAAPAAAGPAASAMDHGTMGPMPAAGAAAATPGVSIRFADFATPRIDVVAGDTVRWSNDSARAHDVVAGDHGFDSGRLRPGDAFTQRFDTPGTVSYFCSLHPFMTGEVDVHPLLLDAPTARAGTGKPFVLTGRAAAGATGTVAIEGDDGAGFRPAGSAAINPDGTFRTTVTPQTSTTYRAVDGAGESPPVQLVVLDHTVAVTVIRHGRSAMLGVRVTPAAPGARVVLQLRLRERFGWWPSGQATLGAGSTAHFTVARRGRVPARVLLTLPDGATELARSRTVHVG
jgi:plastocyanin